MQWYAIRTASRRENTVARKLRNEGFKTFHLRNKCRSLSRRGKPRWSERPHFPTYVFAEAAPQMLPLIRKAGGLVVMFNGTPTPIPHNVMAVLRAGADETGLIKMGEENLRRARFSAMQRVTFTDGPLANTMAEVALDSGGYTIRVLLNMLGAKREVDAPINYIRAAQVS